MIAPFALAIVFNVAEGVQRAMPTVCHTTRVAKYVAQAYDSINTYRVVEHGWRETDQVSKAFGSHNPFAALLGAVATDVITDALTRHSPGLRCAIDARQTVQSADSAIFTNRGGFGQP